MKNYPSPSNYFHRYLQYAASILNAYDGTAPFHLYLKKYFSVNKKHGSRDRKRITSLCYQYFRLGHGVSSSADISEKLLLGAFLIEKESSSFLELLNPAWDAKIHLDTSAKLKAVENIFDVEKIVPFRNEVSDEINFHQFSVSFLVQPKVFIRIRPGHKETVTNKLKSAAISFEETSEHCLSFSNNEKVSDIIKIDEEAVIQDYNSQRTGAFLTAPTTRFTAPFSLWDCCAASGGKAILAYDLLPGIKLTVSDTRESILENLHLRFAKAGIKNYYSFVADLSAPSVPEELAGRAPFDLIIADVPCTGSGTWARTPEQLNFFSRKSIADYVLLQQKIISNAVTFLPQGGYLLYITCSVFKRENEENAAFIEKELPFELVRSQYLKGYELRADTLFAALFIKR